VSTSGRGEIQHVTVDVWRVGEVRMRGNTYRMHLGRDYSETGTYWLDQSLPHKLSGKWHAPGVLVMCAFCGGE
jgi:hypothetical protein